MKPLICILIGICAVFSAAYSSGAPVPAVGKYLHIRNGMPNAAADMKRPLKKGERFCITIFGNRALPCRRIRLSYLLGKTCKTSSNPMHVWAAFPPGGGAMAAAHQYDLNGYGHLPGFLLLELSAGDAGKTDPAALREALRWMYSKIPAKRDFVLVYAPPGRDFVRQLETPEYRTTIAEYEKFAGEHGIPSFDFAAYLHDMIKSGKLRESDIFPEVSDPFSIESDAPEAKRMTRIFEEAMVEAVRQITAGNKKRSTATVSCVDYATEEYPDGWMPWQFSPVKYFLHVLVGSKPGAEFSFDFRGTAISAAGLVYPDSANLEYSIDGGAWKSVDVSSIRPEKGCTYHCALLAKNLEGGGKKHTLKLRIAGNGKSVHIGHFLIEYYRPDPALSGIAGIDHIYAMIPKLEFRPEKSVLADLPATAKKLSSKGKLSILLLGDSIMNGIASSRFEMLLQPMFPDCRIEVKTSVRGSTGCWYYCKAENFSSYVEAKHPDLIIIGGISHRNDIDSVRGTVRLIREKLPESEVILMTDAWGFLNNLDYRDSKFDRPPQISDDTWQGKLKKLAQEEKTACMDITTPWAHYLRKSTLSYEIFKQDNVHANSRGNQLIARIIEAYFAPEGYEPYAEFQKRRSKSGVEK